jgi:hypothetical protein
MYIRLKQSNGDTELLRSKAVGNHTRFTYLSTGKEFGVFPLPESDRFGLRLLVANYLARTDSWWSLVHEPARKREIVLYMHKGRPHHIRIRRKHIAKDYYPVDWKYGVFNSRTYDRVMEVLVRNNVPVTLAQAVEPYTIRVHKGEGW